MFIVRDTDVAKSLGGMRQENQRLERDVDLVDGSDAVAALPEPRAFAHLPTGLQPGKSANLLGPPRADSI